ncbi:hypothetical protein ACMGGR_20615 [Erwinia sp. BNK-24-b]|uniref:hypothetical protein n=1 Tax=Erwinia TaxID=551 RepID=UPI001FF0326C|nr:hypothetical protein [Erwinia phyllosphaerae]MBV4367442.1 hypothetical protein [Erwinia phyllosphaerae]
MAIFTKKGLIKSIVSGKNAWFCLLFAQGARFYAIHIAFSQLPEAITHHRSAD